MGLYRTEGTRRNSLLWGGNTRKEGKTSGRKCADGKLEGVEALFDPGGLGGLIEQLVAPRA